MPEENTPQTNTPQTNTPQNSAALQAASSDPLRAPMTVACERLAESHILLKDCCDKLEALLDAPERNLSALRQASAAVRTAGMRSTGLTTGYLTLLHNYMKSIGA